MSKKVDVRQPEVSFSAQDSYFIILPPTDRVSGRIKAVNNDHNNIFADIIKTDCKH